MDQRKRGKMERKRERGRKRSRQDQRKRGEMERETEGGRKRRGEMERERVRKDTEERERDMEVLDHIWNIWASDTE